MYPDQYSCDLEEPKCENCGKPLESSLYTHCSDKCLFDSIKNSQPFAIEDRKNNSTSNLEHS
ncbi:MAG: hypothetical protein WA833_00215 [Nitrosotalea sp.]